MPRLPRQRPENAVSDAVSDPLFQPDGSYHDPVTRLYDEAERYLREKWAEEKRAKDAEAAVARLREILDAVEWGGAPDFTSHHCPCCYALSGGRHEPGCELRAALDGKEGA